MTSAGRRWVLSPDAFHRLLARLSPDQEAAAQEYERVRRMLLNFFGWRGSPNPGDETDETLDRVARKLEEGEAVEHVHRYIYGVARRVFSESTKKRERERAMLNELGTLPVGRSNRLNEDRSACLESCLPLLSAEDRLLVAEYYEGQGHLHLDHRKDLARRLGITYGALRMRVHRARLSLEVCLTSCLTRKGWDLE